MSFNYVTLIFLLFFLFFLIFFFIRSFTIKCMFFFIFPSSTPYFPRLSLNHSRFLNHMRSRCWRRSLRLGRSVQPWITGRNRSKQAHLFHSDPTLNKLYEDFRPYSNIIQFKHLLLFFTFNGKWDARKLTAISKSMTSLNCLGI